MSQGSEGNLNLKPVVYPPQTTPYTPPQRTWELVLTCMSHAERKNITVIRCLLAISASRRSRLG